MSTAVYEDVALLCREIKKAYMTTAASSRLVAVSFKVQLFQGLAFVQQTSRIVQDALHNGMDQVELPALQSSVLGSIQQVHACFSGITAGCRSGNALLGRPQLKLRQQLASDCWCHEERMSYC